MIIDAIKQDVSKVTLAVTPYREDGVYWGFVDQHSRLIALFSFDLDCDINNSGLGIPVKLGTINPDAFDVMKKSLLTKSVVCYIDQDEQEVYYYRFVIEVTEVDKSNIKIKVEFLDENDNAVSIDDLKLYSAKLPTKENNINRCKIEKLSDNVYNVNFIDVGKFNIKVAGKYKDTKIKIYIPWNI